MSNRIDPCAPRPTAPIESPPPPAGESAPVIGKVTPDAPTPLAEGARRLVATARGHAPTAEQRVAIARAALAPLAEATGRDVGPLAQRYAAAGWGGRSAAEVRSDATFRFVTEALTERPELAGTLLAVRMRGATETDRAIVTRAMAESGRQGAALYREGERVLAELRGFQPEERKDIRGMMEAGMTYRAAVAEERKELARVRREDCLPRVRGPSLEDVRRGSLRASAESSRRVSAETGQVTRALQELGWFTRGAEASLGALHAATSPLGAPLSAVASALRGESLEGNPMAVAGRLMGGEASAAHARARDAAARTLEAASRFEAARERHDAAVRRGDLGEANRAGEAMQRAAEEVQASADQFRRTLPAARRAHREIEHTAQHVAVSVGLQAVTLGTHGPDLVVRGAGHGARLLLEEALVQFGEQQVMRHDP